MRLLQDMLGGTVNKRTRKGAGGSFATSTGGQEVVDARGAVEKIKRASPALEKLMPNGKADVDDLIETLAEYIPLPLEPGKGPMATVLTTAGTVSALGLGGGQLFDIPLPASVAMLTGGLLTAELVSRALMTPWGRQGVKALARSQGARMTLDQAANLLGQSALTAAAREEAVVAPPGFSSTPPGTTDSMRGSPLRYGPQ